MISNDGQRGGELQHGGPERKTQDSSTVDRQVKAHPSHRRGISSTKKHGFSDND